VPSVAGKFPIAVHASGVERQGPDPLIPGLDPENPIFPPKQKGAVDGQFPVPMRVPLQPDRSSKTSYARPFAEHWIPVTQLVNAAAACASPSWNRKAACARI
jgi:hypothetical protein